MDAAFEEYYSTVIKAETFNFDAFPQETKPLLEMILAISICNSEVNQGRSFIPCTTMTPQLFCFFQEEKIKKVKFVVRAHREHMNIVNKNGETCLHFAVRVKNCDEDVLREILKGGSDINKSNKRGESPLHLSARLNLESETTKILLKYGGKPNASNIKGDTPLHIAARWTNVEAVKDLLEHGANIEMTNYNLRTVLHAALENRHPNLYLVKTFLEKCPSLINSKDVRNVTPLHLAVMDCQNKIEAVKELLQLGADVKAKDIAGKTAMHWIQYYSDIEEFDIIQAFIDKGGDINAKDLICRTPLFFAVRSRSHITAKQLILHGAELNSFDFMHKSILNEAVNGFEIGEKLKSFQLVVAETFPDKILKTFFNSELFQPLLNSIFRHSTVIQLVNLRSGDRMIEIDNRKQIETIKLLLEHDADPDFGNLEYRLLPFDTETPCADKLLVQYRVIRNFLKILSHTSEKDESLVTLVQAMTTFHIEIYKDEFREHWHNFRDDCIFEVLRMLQENLCEEWTLYRFVAERCCKSVVSEVPNSAIDELLHILHSNKYTFCKDVIYASIKLSDLVRRSSCLEMSTHIVSDGSSREITLNCHAVGYIAKYLSKIDLINLILAFLPDSKYLQNDNSCNISQVMKRKREESGHVTNDKHLKVDSTKQ